LSNLLNGGGFRLPGDRRESAAVGWGWLSAQRRRTNSCSWA